MNDLATLQATLGTMNDAVVALSGGVDSLTLSHVAHRVLGPRVEMIHAVSPAVPRDATQRVQACAQREGWRLRMIDAGEFADPDYVSNPVNRCFYCKSKLFAAIRRYGQGQILTGANTDDLAEYRPGLAAASEFGVRHPYVEVNFSKAMVRAVAKELGLQAISALPASPCLASRVETGIAIDPASLLAIDRAEKLIAAHTQASTVRCRIRAGGIVVELDRQHLEALTENQRDVLTAAISRLFAVSAKSIRYASYRVGSAFLVLHRG